MKEINIPTTKRKLLLIGWDAADWKAINPLIKKGLMPNLARLIKEGVSGNLATLDPPLSPILWTSISTGKRPYKHGILNFTEPAPNGNGIRPIHSTGRKVKAVWNILTQQQYKTHVIGWWPSHPAEPINGICISNFYQKATANLGEEWPMLKGTVHPASKADFYAKLRVHPGELSEAHLLPFVPKAAEIDQEKDKRLYAVAKIIADCASIQAPATYILENEEWDFMGVYFDGIDHFGHGFMKYNPPRRPHIPEKDYELYKNVITSGYRYHDMILGRLLQLAGEEATVMLISDHGFHPDHLRPKEIPKEPAGPALEHSPYGIICMKGPGIKKGEQIFGANLLDITPTILALYGLEVGRDMDGKVLVNAFEENIRIKSVDSWDDIAGNSGQHPSNIEEDEEQAKEALQQLVDLGYIEKPDDDPKKAIEKTVNESQFYLARAYINGNKVAEAIPILEKLFQGDITQTRYGVRLASAYQFIGENAKAMEVVEIVKEQILEDTPDLLLLEGSILMGSHKFRSAMKKFKQAETINPNLASLHLQIAKNYILLKQWKDAERAFKKEIQNDKDSAEAYHGLGITYLNQNQLETAVDSLLTAVDLQYTMPLAHYHLGEALYLMGEKEEAAKAFEVCLRLVPNMQSTLMWLVRIYKETKNIERLEWLKSTYQKPQENHTITIVSGLPRSGTSMMMQMLHNGGMNTFTDGKREADNNNQKGYYEHEAIKTLMRDKKVMNTVGDKAVKVIAQLLSHLPAKFSYKIVFMERDLNEVIHSQNRMLNNLGKPKTKDNNRQLKNIYQDQLQQVKKWATQSSKVEVLYVKYSDVIKNPLQQAIRVNAFLDFDLNVSSMATVVDANLYREKMALIQ
ncbi:MAG: alkaline phosphatase family protein [Chitinophagales bacterium]